MNRFQSLKFLLFILLTSAFFQPAFAQTAKQNFNRTRTFDVQHYLIRTSFDRQNKAISGDTTVTLKPLNANFDSVELDAANLNFESIKLEPNGKDLQFRTDGEKVIIELGKTYLPKDIIQIRLKYSAKPKKGVYFVNAETDRGTNIHDAQIWTQGESEESHFWFPSYDFPDDKATTEQFLTVEKDEMAISNGELVETLQNYDGTKTFHFKMNVPHSTYLTSFIIGKFVKSYDTYKNIPLGIYVYPGREILFKQAFGNTKEMMRIYEELTGIAFPFNKYDQAIVAHFSLGGMENITATTFSDTEIFFSDFNKNVVEDVVSHELSHSWFGNLVTCRNWAELWLNEGFATFMEAAYREKMYGRDEYIRKINEDAEEYFIQEQIMRRKHGLFNRLARPDDSIFDAVAYQKGGAVVHTLRETVGDEVFWKAINIYLNRHKFGNVETPDLQKVFEETSKKDLKWFFSQWVYGIGYPKLEAKYQYNAKTKILTLNVNQTQKTDDLTPSAFILPMELEITTANGVVNEKIFITKRTEAFSIKLENAPTDIVFDENLKIPLKTLKINN
jgi:aminopeptidase N